jgi:hypothetical protein
MNAKIVLSEFDTKFILAKDITLLNAVMVGFVYFYLVIFLIPS